MKSQIKKLISIFACVCLLLTAIVIPASAADSTASYVKVTEAPADWSGDYLIVYENGANSRVLDGGLDNLDAEGNYITAAIVDNKIEATDATNAAKFTIEKNGSAYAIKSASGKYIGNSKDQNKLLTDKKYDNTLTLQADGSVDIVSANSHLRSNIETTNGNRFRYYKSSTYTKQKAVALYKLETVTGGDEPSCEHTAKSAVPNGDETHKLVCDACSETVTPTVDCTDADINGKCDVCGGDVALPVAKTIAEVLAMADGDTKFYVTAEIVDTYRDTWATYGNFILKDDSTDETIIMYGLHDEAGNQYDAMETKPVVGDTIKVLANRSSYKGVGQLANAVLVELIPATPDEGGDDVTPPADDEGDDDITPPTDDSALEIVDTPVAGTAYKFGMVQGNLENAVYYLAGGMDGYYLATTTDAAAAIDLYIEETTGGYYLYTMVDGAKTYINFVTEEKDGKTYVNGAYEATASTVYTYDADAKTMVATVNDELYWLATRNDKTYTTLGPAKVSFAGFYGQFYAEAKGDDTTGDDTTGGDSTTGGTTTGGTTGGSTTGSTTTTPEVKPNTDNSTTSPDTGDNVGAFAVMAIAAAAVVIAASKKRA